MATQEPASEAIIPDEEIIDLEQDVDEVVPEDLSSDPEELKAELVKEREARRQITARAKKAEGKLKDLNKPKNETAPVTKKPDQDQQPSQTLIDVDERILLSQGEDQDFLIELKDIAKMKGISLIDAKSSELGVAAKKIFDDKKKSNSAALGTSRGSGTKKPELTLSTPGLSEEQHKKMALDALRK